MSLETKVAKSIIWAEIDLLNKLIELGDQFADHGPLYRICKTLLERFSADLIAETDKDV